MSKLEFPTLTCFFSRKLFSSFAWFQTVRDLYLECNCCELAVEDTSSSAIVRWSSSNQNFIDDQVVVVVNKQQLSMMTKDMSSEIASWPNKYGKKFVTLLVVLEAADVLPKDVESKIIYAQLDSHFNLRSVYNASEIFQLLLCMTRAVAEKYSKILRYEILGFEGGKRSTSTGKDAWISFLEIFFSQASTQLAKATAKKYPSVNALRRELLKKPVTEVFEDIRVTVGQPPLQKIVKIGPETANKLYNFFTQDDPQYLV